MRQGPHSVSHAEYMSSGFAKSTLWLCGCLMLAGGCAGYQRGSGTLFRRDIQTIHVPIVRNDGWRPMLGQQVTEALQKAIQLRTPYRVVGDASADSVLTCRVLSDSKRTLTETTTDEPRALETTMTIQLTWVDRRGNLLMENRFLPPGEVAYLFNQSMDFVPEGGQSIATAYQRAAERLADEIVNQMELRW